MVSKDDYANSSGVSKEADSSKVEGKEKSSEDATASKSGESEKEDNAKKISHQDDEKNFTWEHFFHVHCGVLRIDAQAYEKALIAQRMNPLDCLLESLNLVVTYGQIPLGDQMKIKKL